MAVEKSLCDSVSVASWELPGVLAVGAHGPEHLVDTVDVASYHRTSIISSLSTVKHVCLSVVHFYTSLWDDGTDERAFFMVVLKKTEAGLVPRLSPTECHEM